MSKALETRRVALVSGGCGGIGGAVLSKLRDEGYSTVCLDRASSRGAVADLTIECDIKDPGECETAVAEAVSTLGQLDVLVNSAGVNYRAPFAETDVAAAREVFDVNVWGSVNLMRAAYPALAESPCAAVVLLTSINGEVGIPGGAIYGMSKMALSGIVRTLAVEWADIPIRVNAVAPAIVPTAMNAEVRKRPDYMEKKLRDIPMGRMIEADEVADAVVFLAGGRSSAITGEVLHVDGGAVVR